MAKKKDEPKWRPCPQCNGTGTEWYRRKGRDVPYPCRMCGGKKRVSF